MDNIFNQPSSCPKMRGIVKEISYPVSWVSLVSAYLSAPHTSSWNLLAVTLIPYTTLHWKVYSKGANTTSNWYLLCKYNCEVWPRGKPQTIIIWPELWIISSFAKFLSCCPTSIELCFSISCEVFKLCPLISCEAYSKVVIPTNSSICFINLYKAVSSFTFIVFE